MKEEVNKTLLKDAEELFNRPDVEIMALSLGKNEKWAENLQMAMTIKLRRTLLSLNENIEKFNLASKISSGIMIVLTIILAILTTILVCKGL